MRMFCKLYQKELRQHQGEYLALFAIMVLLLGTMSFTNSVIFSHTLARFSIRYSQAVPFLSTLMLFSTFLMIILPSALFMYSLYDETRTASRVQGFSLPVPRYILILSKCAAIPSMTLLFDIFVVYTVKGLTMRYDYDVIDSYSMAVIIFPQLLLLSIMGGASLVAMSANRNRLLIGFIAAFILSVLFGIFMQGIRALLIYAMIHSAGQALFIGLPFLVLALFSMITLFISIADFHTRAEV